MEICAYSSPIINTIYNLNFQKIRKKLSAIGLSNSQINELYKLLSDHYSDSTFKQRLSSFMDTLPIQKITEIYIIIEDFFEMQSVSFDNYKTLLDNEIEKRTNKNITNHKYYMCPVYGQISAGQPNWAEENIEGRLPVDPDLMNIADPEECFFLRVNGESMNKLIKDGGYALIRKQDIVENGEIAVVLVNGYDATLKKFSKQGDLIILEPMSTDSSFTTQVYDKNTPIRILGKYIGKFEMN